MSDKRMKSFLLWFLLFSVLVLIRPLGLMAEDYLSMADGLYEQGGEENYKGSIDAYLKALKETLMITKPTGSVQGHIGNMG